MAAILKVQAFRKWTCLVFFGFMIILYLWQKLEHFWEQCAEEDEGKGTELTSALISMWNWIVSSLWSRSQAWEKGHRTQAEEQLTPPCQAPATDILCHIVIISTVTDICRLCAALSTTADTVFVSTRDLMKEMVSGSRVWIASSFNVSSHLFWEMAANLRAGLGDVWAYVSVAFRDAVSSFPDDFRTVSIIVCLLCLLFIVFVVCRRRHQVQVRNKLRYSTHYISNNSSSNVTPVKRRGQNSGGEIVPRFEADTVPGERTPCGSLCVEQEAHSACVRGERTAARMVMGWTVCTMVLLLGLSLPWEFCRLYQTAIANKAAVASAGLPVECSTEPQSLLQTLTLWLSRQLAWSHGNPCDRYYQAMFVDPIWEITPIMVLTSVITRSVVHPVELAASGLGRALRHFFQEIPLHWQPACMLLMLTLLVLLLLLACRYRLSVPMLFRMEPRTPVLGAGRTADARPAREGQQQQRRVGSGDCCVSSRDGRVSSRDGRVSSRDCCMSAMSRGGFLASPDSAGATTIADAEALHALYQGAGDLGGRGPQTFTRLSASPARYKKENTASDDSHPDLEIHEKGYRDTRLINVGKFSQFGETGRKGCGSSVIPRYRGGDDVLPKENVGSRNKAGRNGGGERKLTSDRSSITCREPLREKEVMPNTVGLSDTDCSKRKNVRAKTLGKTSGKRK